MTKNPTQVISSLSLPLCVYLHVGVFEVCGRHSLRWLCIISAPYDSHFYELHMARICFQLMTMAKIIK